MPLSSGRRLGDFEILSPLGAGGMGEVYQARDPKLGRDVAIKVLPGDSLHDEAARARLMGEARLAATLNHPNICTVHEVGEAEGHIYLAMELIEGRPLRELVGERPAGLPTENVLGYGVQIATALAHAHNRHVIHRDLKSSNVIVTHDGRVKVLDFGLARRAHEAPTSDSIEPTMAQTKPGTIVGTPQYLAPEVLRGSLADERSDLWALGVLLYEMAAGRLPFKGATTFELASAILNDMPLPLPARVPAGLQGCIRRCLAKDPGERYARASEVRSALEALESGKTGITPALGVRAWRRLPIALVLAGLVAAFLVVWYVRREPTPSRELHQRQLTSNAADDPVGTAAISPDGKTLAVVDRSGLSLRSIESGESRPMELPAGFAFERMFPCICWFPDGSQILVTGRMVDGRSAVWALPVAGGRMRKLLDDALFAMLSPDGTRMAFLRRDGKGSEIWVCGLSGDGPRLVAADDSSGVIPTWAVWSPNGERLAYGRYAEGSGVAGPRLESCDLSGRIRVFYTPPADQPLHPLTVPAWLPDGRVVFGSTDPPPNQRDMNLWELRVDPRTGAPSGNPRRVTQWQRLSLVMATSYSTGGQQLAVSVIEYKSDIFVGRISPEAAPLLDVQRLTLDDRMDLDPAWMEDDSTLLFSSDRNGTLDIFRQRVDTTPADPIVTGTADQFAPCLSPDGKWILYLEGAATGPGSEPVPLRLMRVQITGGPTQQVLETRGSVMFRSPRDPGASPVLCEFQNGSLVFTMFDPLRGRGREFSREQAEHQPPWDLSPDGLTIALVDQQQDSIPHIRLLSTVGAPPRDIRLERPIQIASIAYGADALSWLIVAIEDGWKLLRVDERGRLTALIPPQPWMYSAAASPGGKHIAYTSNTVQSNIWMLEGY